MAGIRPAEGPFHNRPALAETPPRCSPREAQFRKREEAGGEAVAPTQSVGKDSSVESLGPASERGGQPLVLACCQLHFAEPGYSVESTLPEGKFKYLVIHVEILLEAEIQL